MKYEKSYHKFFHRNLLQKPGYYEFRAKSARIFYWKYLNGKKFLEFGCGLGQNIFLHKEQAIGVDVSNLCISECKKRGIRVVRSTRSLKSNSFDGILSVHCLEHLKQPLQNLMELHRLLKKTGRLVLVLPHEKNYPSLKRTKSRHLYNWTFKSINELLRETGFKPILNKFNYARGYSLFYKSPFPLALFLTKLFGRLSRNKEMLIVAEKEKEK